MCWWLWISLLVSFSFAERSAGDELHCSREHARIVRNTLRQHFFPAFEKQGIEVPEKCSLHESHDLYINQEINKIEEHVSSWKCDLCGKTFYGEYFLDVHFHNRHQDKLVEDSPVCLADYCDIFRCDFLLDHKKDMFWEKSLCNENKLAILKRRCEVLMHSCLPEGNLLNQTEYNIYDSTTSSICSLLTCKNYWKPPYYEMPAWRIILYAIVTPFFIMGLFAYYYCAWEYYYGDLFHDTSSEMEQHSPRYVRSWQQGGDLRNRYPTRPIHMY
ncbi:uncharacterized protein LOC116304506 [Actinia tenebrosa]|uniref:Uncharacterized protein LOC116304506 n=1 Tax=Actinia tenebrosa TaxID=6105 RepID=A0A6P8IT50_ACTTE|nr:uncharacterized protein LOC116304506 [Actinia tenebrosa]